MKRFLIPIIIVFFDQLTKFLSKDKHFFIVNYQENYGAAFSILQGQLLIFIAVAILVIFLIFFYYNKVKYKIGLLFILGGTIGNLIDRIFLGLVRDFIDLKIWPVFNIADSANVIGAAILAYYLIKTKNK
ncbi:signal peptidase II [archaeon]|nr:signal peptidase II [archaeon]|tara:strand:- start:1467 stop:1856 length:390 start_codon:yes stop_codon:yes gene_type:complete